MLDELTSGLDAAKSLRRGYLKELAEVEGVTVVAVLHQPRLEIFQQLENVILLSAGELVYSGRFSQGLPLRHLTTEGEDPNMPRRLMII